MPIVRTIPPTPAIQFYSIMFSQKIILHFFIGHAKLVMDMLNIPYIDVKHKMTMYMVTSLIYRTVPGTFMPYPMVCFLVKFKITNISIWSNLSFE